MLKQPVIDAVAEGNFEIFAVNHIDECMQILTGLEAGKRDADGHFPDESINQRINQRLTGMAEKQRSFSKEPEPDRRKH